MVRFLSILFLAFVACNSPSNKSTNYLPNTVSTNNADTLIVNTKAAIFFFQDSTQIELRKKNINVEDFYVGADDAMYYLSVAREFVDSVKLNKIEPTQEKFIKFIDSNKIQTLIKIDTLKALCGVYFFEPSKQPYLINLTMPEEEYKNYFRQ
jgi:short-subunit dehydrogenase